MDNDLHSTTPINKMAYGFLGGIMLIITFYPITSLGFAAMDDNWMLLGDQLVRPKHLNWTYIYTLFTSYNSVQYSPLNTLYYYLIYCINGYDPYWFHIFSLFVHLLNMVLVFLFMRRVLNLSGYPGAEKTAYLGCLIWGLHPLNVETVVWASASKIPLYAMFTFFSLLTILKFISTKSILNYLLSLFSFLLACLCKEQAVILPLTIGAFFTLSVKQSHKLSLKNWLLAAIPFLIVALIFGVITVRAQQSVTGVTSPVSLYGFADRLIFSFYCLCFYVFNTVLPIALHYQYDYPMKPGEALPLLYYFFPLGFSIIIGCIIVVLRKKPKRLGYMYWALFFFINIFLCIQIVPMRRPAIMADRYMYLPLIGLLMIGLIFIKESMSAVSIEYRKLWRNLLYGGGAVYLLIIIIISNQMVYNWQQYNLIIK